MSAPPKTVLHAADAEAEAIRRAVRTADVGTLGPGRVRADLSHVAGLVALLSDPRVSDPIYDLPRPICEDSVTRWVAEGQAQALAGEGLLILTLDPKGGVSGYSKISIWPERASGELAGAVRADVQSRGQGGPGAAHTFGWMFETLGLRLIGLTAALDNVRSAKLIEAAGFVPMGEREAKRPDGSVRISRYWELTRDEWRQRHRL
ncbi:GNAT family protein [Phenylobacterium sp.]|jgi:RimJ/RimL family protein N-acetyltransferase|uniref:GNAT family N-acetyltransferase n=1 Tax=Phenylobacterium sp. TaxID=1871053 RepID=UPI002E317698|nr:GNAT family protein [Phenylobacterium sp.]HEX4712509.1 GNAT family protein [Phenylobacterium sp.]